MRKSHRVRTVADTADGYSPSVVEPRSFEDPSPEARALDVLGDRWALLIVRELLFGPRRFGALRRGLPRASQSVLSTRLRALTEAGVVGRPEHSYELTEHGQALKPTLIELVRWGHGLPVGQTGEAGASATMLELLTWSTPVPNPDLTLRLGPDTFVLRPGPESLAIQLFPETDAPFTTRLTTGVPTFRAIAFGPLDLDRALDHRLARLDGPAQPWVRLFRAVSRPAR